MNDMNSFDAALKRRYSQQFISAQLNYERSPLVEMAKKFRTPTERESRSRSHAASSQRGRRVNNDTATIKQLMALMRDYYVDELKVGDIHIKKTVHFPPEKPQAKQTTHEDEDELLFHSSNP